MRKLSIILIGVTFLLAACSMGSSFKSKDAVKGAIEAHLRGNPNLSMENFDTQIEQVNFKDDTADTLAKFVSRSDPKTSVEVRYQLKFDKVGHQWTVVKSTSAGGQGMNAHPVTGATPQPMPPPANPNQPSPESSH